MIRQKNKKVETDDRIFRYLLKDIICAHISFLLIFVLPCTKILEL